MVREVPQKLDLLLRNLRHPSLRAKKYDEARELLQGLAASKDFAERALATEQDFAAEKIVTETPVLAVVGGPGWRPGACARRP